jgi:tetratricopeptide (TPR) repeat protein
MIAMNFMRRVPPVLVLLLLLGAGAAIAQPADPQTATLPLTTKSTQVLRLVDDAWRLELDQLKEAEGIEALHKAIAVDPDFAMGHELLAMFTLDPAEGLAEQQKAFALREHASPAERLLIEWWQDSADHQLISAITKMNDLLSQYPNDRWVVFMATNWLMGQMQYARAATVYERSGVSAPGMVNNMAYNYAYMRQFDKAMALMDRYAAAMPHDPNPQDSYAEILRMAGHFDEAIAHYRKALEIDPQFYASAFGIADTYSLMGDQVRARAEYNNAFQKFPLGESELVTWRMREGTTFVREGNFGDAVRAFQAAADDAHSKRMSQIEAHIYQRMAMLQQDPKLALGYLDKAEAAIKEGSNAMPADLQQLQAQILRTRVEIFVKMDDRQKARTSLAQLADLSASSNDKVIEAAYHGAAGAELFSERKYDEAVTHLEEDHDSALSLRLLAAAYEKVGYSAGAKRTEETLANFNDATLEQALVVPAFRKCYEDPACSGRINASLH